MTELLDNRAYRIQMLKEIIRRLHEGGGKNLEEVRRQLRELVRRTDASEIAAMEQQLLDEGIGLEQIQSMCDLHAQLLQEIMVQHQPIQIPPGHPLDTFHRENQAILDRCSQIRRLIGLLRQKEAPDWQKHVLELRATINELMDIDKHYRRKENLLFPMLEKYGITGPSRVMWRKDDEVRQLLRRMVQVLAETNLSYPKLIELLDTTAEPCLQQIEGMVFKEENILFPMAQQTLSEEDWARIWYDSGEYGWCLVEPAEGYRPPESVAPDQTAQLDMQQAIPFPTGHLTPQQIQAIFNTLPVDLTFVDAQDRVSFFSEGPHRIFTRSKAILGRKVQFCHPPASVHVVDQILDDFRSGRRNVAEFWIQFRGRFVHIRYFAVRSPEGEYLGTLEVTQDLTPLRALQGERRLLQYD
ncbi:MAG: DUF438 domain-containing protein [Thermoguttaceae bacterium]|nr:DUF438 domain-containing protein [Thermoguttaceae bacterium]MDW8036504.1 DUF438 domain-containing protein [Thermoguttaceae bacterium]